MRLLGHGVHCIVGWYAPRSLGTVAACQQGRGESNILRSWHRCTASSCLGAQPRPCMHARCPEAQPPAAALHFVGCEEEELTPGDSNCVAVRVQAWGIHLARLSATMAEPRCQGTAALLPSRLPGASQARQQHPDTSILYLLQALRLSNDAGTLGLCQCQGVRPGHAC